MTIKRRNTDFSPPYNETPNRAESSPNNRERRGPDELWNETRTAGFLDVETATLQRWRWLGRNLRYIKVGRCVRYRRSDVEAFLEANTRFSTTDQVEGSDYE